MGATSLTPCDKLEAGEVGYLTASIKTVRDTRVGDTVTLAANPTPEPLPGFRITHALVVGNLMDAAGSVAEDLAAEREDWAGSDLVAALAGLVGEVHAKAFAKIYRGGGGNGVPTAENVLKNYPAVRNTVTGWVKAKQTDLLAGVAHGVRVVLQNSDLCAEIAKSKTMRRNLEDFAKDLPADLGRKVRAAAKDGGAL